jgi:hypothetical protein
MTLPVIVKQKFIVKNQWLPKKGVEYTAFNIGHESILLSVMEDLEKETDPTQAKHKLLYGVKQVLQDCIVTPDIDAGTLPTWVVEDLFLRIRQKSVGEQITVYHTCKEKLEGTEEVCNHKMEVIVNLEEVKIAEPEGFQKTFKINDEYSMSFHYPTFDLLDSIEGDSNEINIIAGLIDKIYTEEEVFDAQNYTPEERLAFLNNLELTIKKDIYAHFFSKFPSIEHKIETKCPKCGAAKLFRFDGINDFFQYPLKASD